jgi:hypothetical protein
VANIPTVSAVLFTVTITILENIHGGTQLYPAPTSLLEDIPRIRFEFAVER